MSLAIVFGTYNRLPHLQRAVASLRRTLDGLPADLIVVDGGSADGTREWLVEQDVTLIKGDLSGAVRNFNLGFAHAIAGGCEFVGHFNDDAEALDVGMWQRARDLLSVEPGSDLAAVAFRFDLRGSFAHEEIHGRPYVNFGLWRTKVMWEVACAQGDSSGLKFWDPSYRTYGADTQASAWAWRLGYRILTSDDRVHDLNVRDGLRERNNVGQKDSALFWRRWAQESSVIPGGYAQNLSAT